MIKRTTTETVYEYDNEGKVIRKVVTETSEEDTNVYWPNTVTTPLYSNPTYCSEAITASNANGTASNASEPIVG